MTEETGASAAPVDEQAVTAPAVTDTAPPDTGVAIKADAEPDQAGKPSEQEGESLAPEGEGDSTARQKLTRNQRLQRKAARLSTMLAEQQAEIERLRAATAKSDADSEPKEADYNGDWTKFQADYAAWKAAQSVERKLAEREQRERERQVAEKVREANEEFLERVDEVKAGIPDYDQAINAFASSGGKFAEHVIEEIRDSEQGPMLAYYIAKNPHIAHQLNAMSPRDAAREIGRIEARVALPKPKRQTQAPAPLAPLKGGAAPSADIHQLAKQSDLSAYIAARNAQEKARA